MKYPHSLLLFVLLSLLFVHYCSGYATYHNIMNNQATIDNGGETWFLYLNQFYETSGGYANTFILNTVSTYIYTQFVMVLTDTGNAKGNYYSILSLSTGKVLSSNSDGDTFPSAFDDSNNFQKWYSVKRSSGYQFFNVATGRALIYSQVTRLIRTTNDTDSPYSLWSFPGYDSFTYDSYYVIKSYYNPTLAWDSTDCGIASVSYGTVKTSAGQKWIVYEYKNKDVSFLNLKTGRVLMLDNQDGTPKTDFATGAINEAFIPIKSTSLSLPIFDEFYFYKSRSHQLYLAPFKLGCSLENTFISSYFYGFDSAFVLKRI